MAWAPSRLCRAVSSSCFHRAVSLPRAPRGLQTVKAAAGDLAKGADGRGDGPGRPPKAWPSPLDLYSDALDANPVLTKALTSCVGFFIGDRLAQTIGGLPFDPFRSLRLSLYGLLLDGPVGHWWYEVLDARVCPGAPQSTQAVLLKTAADQLLWAPAMTCVFFAFLKTLEGHPEAIVATIQAKLWITIAANYVLWPLAHFVSFKLVPLKYRILFNNVVSIAWTCYLSFTCGGPAAPLGIDGGGGNPVQCHGGLSPADVPGAGAHQVAALDALLGAWGVAGLPGQPEAALELLGNYVDLKTGLLRQACSMRTPGGL